MGHYERMFACGPAERPGMIPTVERMTARNSAGYDAPVGLAADPVVFTLVDGDLCVLLARRLEEPQRGTFALPGGFVGAEESPRETAERKLREKTGVGSVHLEQLRTYASPDRDPRGWLPSIAYLALVPPESLPADGPSGREASWHRGRRAARARARPRDRRRRRALAPARAARRQGVVRPRRRRAADRAVHARPGAAALRGAARRAGRRRELPPRRARHRLAGGDGRAPLGGPRPPGQALPPPIVSFRATPP